MVVDMNQYFAFWDIFLYEVVGDLWLLIILGLLVVFLLSAMFRIPFQATMILSLLFLMVISGIMFNQLIWVLVVTAVGFISFFIISRLMGRG